MNFWNQIPFLRLLLPFLAGILTAIYSGKQIESIEYVLFGIFILIALFVLIKRLNIYYKYSWIYGTFATALLFFCGFQIAILNTDKFKPVHFSKFSDAGLFYVKANESILEKEKSYKVSLIVMAVKQNGKWVETSGKAMCYFKKDSISKNIRYGDCMVLKAKFTEVKPPQNPAEFNYKRFLSFHNIYHQTYIPSGNWMPLGINEGNKIIRYSISLRESLLNIYKKNNITGQELAVGSALVLGYDDKIDHDLISAYASSGALHVLSVSGLHVGIIYVIFNYLLLFLDKFKHGKFIKMPLLLFLLWFYATLTGLSPSVLRSAAMFSFIVIAQTWKYHTNIFNTLAVSCFALLMYNPYLIMEVGFQLSYLAVLGIVAIQPWIYDRWQPKTWLIDQVWLITSVSIAAQLATFPLGLLYFHQFPNYFLFSNLIVIPLSTLILGYGLLLFILGNISAIGITCGKIFSGLVWFLNKSVRVVDQTPGALMQGISINILETWIIYSLVVLVITFIYKKQARYFFTSLGSIILLLSLQTIEAHSIRKQKAIIVYNIPGISAYDFISGEKTVFLADSFLINNPGKLLFHIRHNWWERSVTRQEMIGAGKSAAFYDPDIFIKNNFIQFSGKRVAVISALPKIKSPISQKFSVDLILLAKNPKIKIKDLKKWYDFKKVIFDSSNPVWKTEKWKKECEEMKVGFYSVSDSGAYIEEL
ncbi:MAG: ComEC family competence protein [Bacteroidetes bacterium]|nr:MAG: ComEC family competence protein [Bacteroidota bacterium]